MEYVEIALPDGICIRASRAVPMELLEQLVRWHHGLRVGSFWNPKRSQNCRRMPADAREPHLVKS
jgi:hypothetical protein